MVRMSEIRIVPMVREGNMYCLFIFFCMIDWGTLNGMVPDQQK